MANITIDELSNKIFNDVKEKTLEFVKFIDVNTKNINKVVVHCMELVEKYKNISGEEKFHLVVKIMNYIINTLNIDEDDKKSLELLLPNTIETISKVSRSGFNVQNKNLAKLNSKKVTDLIYNKTKAILVSDSNFNIDHFVNNTTQIIFSIVNLIEEMPSIPKRIKKDIVIHVVKRLMSDLLNIDENNKNILKAIINTLPDTIDLVVAAANGKLELNQQTIQQVSNCCIKLIGSLCSKTNTT
jgi:hypothetical protein